MAKIFFHPYECECNPTEYTIKVVLSGIIRLTSALADIINK